MTRALVGLFGCRLPLSRCVSIVLASYSLSLIGGGQATYTTAAFRWLRSNGVPGEAALATGVIPALINVLTMAGVSMFGLTYLLVVHKLSFALVLVFALALLLLLVMSLLLWWGVSDRQGVVAVSKQVDRLLALIHRRPNDPGPAEAIAERVFRAWSLLVRGGWRGPVLGDALNVGFDILTLYLLFVAAHYVVSPGVVLAGYGLPLLAGKLSVFPGGLGIVEGGMVALYESLGVPSAVAVVVILSYRLLSFWIPVLLGLSLIPLLGREAASQIGRAHV